MDDSLASMMWMVEYVDTNRVSLSLVIIVFYGILKRLIGVVVRGIQANFSAQQATPACGPRVCHGPTSW